jgi:hypothetical protein
MSLVDEVRKIAQDIDLSMEEILDELYEAQDEIDSWISDLEGDLGSPQEPDREDSYEDAEDAA